MILSKYFSLYEMTFSPTAIRKNIDNTPSQEALSALTILCNNCLDKIREAINAPVRISSGFRCKKLNTAIGGAKNSQHILGQAADISTDNLTTEQLYQFIKKSGIVFDQLIQEFDSWVHVSYSDNNRNECLRAVKQNNKTVYKKD